MAETIAFYVGRFTSFNVRQTVRNIGRMIGDEFDLHLVTSCPDAFPGYTDHGYSVYSGVEGDTLRAEIRLLRRYLDAQSPDIVTHIGDVPVYGNIIAALKDEDSKFVCRYSGDLFTEYKHQTGLEAAKILLLKNGFGRLPMRYADRIITMGPREKRRIVDRGAPAPKVKILPPPIDRSRFERTGSPAELDVDEMGPIALFVGRVSRLKGAETLERSVPAVLERRPDLEFVFVGERQFEFDLPDRYEERVWFTGRVPPNEVPAYFDAADVYVHPSLTEGVSRSVLEALACDTPVVVRDVGDLAYATSNIFATDDDFVEMVADFENLAVDSCVKFTMDALEPKYVSAFRDV
jgi:glycosyltransferase involved in cell wall biosynthesis